jgi:hypothetical protein
MPVAVDTAGRIYEDFSRLLFLHAHREASTLSNEIPEESQQFRFLRAAFFANIKGSVGLILAEASAMRISIPLDLSSRLFSSVFCLRGTCGDFSYKLYRLFLTSHSCNETIFTFDFRLFLILLKITQSMKVLSWALALSIHNKQLPNLFVCIICLSGTWCALGFKALPDFRCVIVLVTFCTLDPRLFLF